MRDPATVDRLARFLKASVRGWNWARDNTEEAAGIVLDNDTTGAQTEKHQNEMMKEIVKLLDPDPAAVGKLSEADYKRTVSVLLGGGSEPVIAKEPQGATSTAVWDAAAKL